MWNWVRDAKNLSAVGTILGGVGSAYGAYRQGKEAKGLLDLQKKNYYYNKKRQEQAQLDLDSAVDDVYGGLNAKA
jgi:hypothetical protein